MVFVEQEAYDFSIRTTKSTLFLQMLTEKGLNFNLHFSCNNLVFIMLLFKKLESFLK